MHDALSASTSPSSPNGTQPRINRPSASQVPGTGASGLVSRDFASGGAGTEKPRTYIAGKFYDNGYEYERWMCAGRYRVGRGPTPEAAYDDWARMTNVDKREGL